MFRPRNPHQRRTDLAVESLEDRVVLSAGGAAGTAAHAAAAHATTHRAAVIVRFEAAVDRLNRQFQSQAQQLEAGVNSQVARSDAEYQGVLSQTAARINTGAVVNVPRDAASLNQAATAVALDVKQSISIFDLRWNRVARHFDHRLEALGQQYVKADPALESTVLAAQGNFEEEAASPGMLVNQLQVGSNHLQKAIAAARTAVARYHSPRPASVRVAAHPAGSQLPSSAVLANGPTPLALSGNGISPFLGPGATPGSFVGPIATTGMIAGSAGNGAFGVGTVTGTGTFVGGTAPSPVTGTTGAGVFTGLDTFGIGTGFDTGTGIDLTPDGAAPLF